MKPKHYALLLAEPSFGVFRVFRRFMFSRAASAGSLSPRESAGVRGKGPCELNNVCCLPTIPFARQPNRTFPHKKRVGPNLPITIRNLQRSKQRGSPETNLPSTRNHTLPHAKFQTHQRGPPLPKGEGWGEGEGTTRTQQCVLHGSLLRSHANEHR